MDSIIGVQIELNASEDSKPADLSKLTISGLLMRLDRLTLPGNRLSDESGRAYQARKPFQLTI